jgi:hypothetical protein
MLAGYPKNDLANYEFQINNESVIMHSAIAKITNIMSCEDNGHVSSSNNKDFTTRCNQNRSDNDLRVYHETDLNKCVDTCATYN